MFTRSLVGLDGSPRADAALEQAVVLGERFHSTIIVAHVREGGGGTDGDAAELLDRARERVAAAGLVAEGVAGGGEPDNPLAEPRKAADAPLVGRPGGTPKGHTPGPTA